MKDFEKGLYPSKSNANRNLPSSGSLENDENDLNGDKLIPQFENRKITYGNHFMAGVPRKKILAEIKQNPSSSDAQAHKNSNLELEKSPPKKGVSDSSSKVYDPLKNYLSPRPQFLRFNPNRRREILKRLEKELNSSLDFDSDFEEASDEEEESADSSLLPSEGSDVNQKNGGICEEDNGNVLDVYEAEGEEIADSSRSPPNGNAVCQINGGMSEEDNNSVVDGYESEEEEEMERGWSLRRILKLLFTLIACLSLSSYICPMNSPTDSLTQQAIWDFKDGRVLIKNQSLEFVSSELCGNGFFEVHDGGNYSIEEAEAEEENYGETEAEIVEYLKWHEREMVEIENDDSEEDIVDKSIEEVEVEEENYGETDKSIEAQIVEYLEWHEQDMVDEAAEFEGVTLRAAEFEYKVDEFEHLIDAKTDKNLDSRILLDMEVVSSSYTGSNEDEDNVNNDEAAETEIIGGGVVDSEAESSGQLISPKTVGIEDASRYMLEMHIDSSNQLPEPQLLLRSISEAEPEGAEDTGSHKELSDDYMDEVDDIEDTEVGMEKSEWNTVVGVSAVLLIVSRSLAIVYHSRRSRRSTSSKESEPLPKQKLAVVENVNPVLPPIDRKVEFLARAPLPSHSTREAPIELASNIHAPIVELIGEIAVGQPSRARNSGKFQMIISEDECNAAASSVSASTGSLPELVPALSLPSAIEPRPSISSTSCGCFSTERKISKKEGGQGREAMIGTTPVRRSSRIRNRQAVSSP